MFQPQFEQNSLFMKLEITYRTMFVPTPRASAHQFTGQCFKVYDEITLKVEYRFQTAYFEIRAVVLLRPI